MQAKVTITTTVDEAVLIKRALVAYGSKLTQDVRVMAPGDGKALREEAGRVADLIVKFKVI